MSGTVAIKDDDIDTAKEMVQKYKEKLKKYRSCGLEKEGEYSTENSSKQNK